MKEKKRNTYSWCETARRYTLDVTPEVKPVVEPKPTKKPAKKPAAKKTAKRSPQLKRNQQRKKQRKNNWLKFSTFFPLYFSVCSFIRNRCISGNGCH